MTQSVHEQWKRNSQIFAKSCAQVGTLVVAKGRQPISGELRSSRKQATARKKARLPALHIRYQSNEEVELIKARSVEAGLSLNGYIRATTLGNLYKPPRDPDLVQELRLVKRQLTGIGINLNQLMHAVNAGTGHIDSALDYIDIIRDPVLESIKLLRDALARSTDGPMP